MSKVVTQNPVLTGHLRRPVMVSLLPQLLWRIIWRPLPRCSSGHHCAGQGQKVRPPVEVLQVTYIYSKGYNLPEQQRHCHCQEFNSKCICRLIHMVLQLSELPVFFCPNECGPERDGTYRHVGALGEIEEGPIGVSEQVLRSLVFFLTP